MAPFTGSGCSPTSPLRDLDINIAAKQIQQSHQLSQRLRVVRRIQEAVELSWRRPKRSRDLTSREPGTLKACSRRLSQPVQNEISHVRRILVVLEDGIDVHAALGTRSQPKRKSFTTELRIHECLRNSIADRWSWVGLGVRENEVLSPRSNLEEMPAIVGRHAQDLQSKPSFTSSLSSRRIRADA